MTHLARKFSRQNWPTRPRPPTASRPMPSLPICGRRGTRSHSGSVGAGTPRSSGKFSWRLRPEQSGSTGSMWCG